MKKNSLIRIAIAFVVSLLAFLFLCIGMLGSEKILHSAMRVKPYSVILSLRTYARSHDDKSPTIIYFGDSTAFQPPDKSFPKSKNYRIQMGGLLNTALREDGVSPAPRVLQFAYAGASMFDYYCLFYEAERFSPDLIIVPINWRAFGTAWIQDENFFHPELSALVPIFDEFSLDRSSPIRKRRISRISQIRFKILQYQLYPIGIKIWLKDNLKTHFSNQSVVRPPHLFRTDYRLDKRARQKMEEMQRQDKFFPSRIETSNINFQSLIALANLASLHKKKVLFFIWPLDQMKLHLDNREFERSKAVIMTAIDNEYTCVLDLSNCLQPKHFADIGMHCKVEGRREICRVLASEIKEIMEEAH